jgi:hypothetical protein
MSGYVFLTSLLFQRGSPESKPFEGDATDQDPRQARDREEVPRPVRRGGLVLGLYEHSFALLLFGIFLACFAVHAIGGAAEFNAEQLAHGEQPVSVLGFVTTSQFWFQSFQNWQSEFLVVGAVALLGIRLREQNADEFRILNRVLWFGQPVPQAGDIRQASHGQPVTLPDGSCMYRTSTSSSLTTGWSMSLSSRTSGAPYLEWVIAFIGCSCAVTGLGRGGAVWSTRPAAGSAGRRFCRGHRRTTQQ